MLKKTKTIIILVIIISFILTALGCKKYNNSSNIDATGSQKNGASKGLPEKLPSDRLKAMVGAQDAINKFAEAKDVFEKKYGASIEFVAAGWKEWETKAVTALTSGDAFDIIRFSPRNMPRFAVKELLQPIDDYFDFNDPLWEDSLSSMEQFKYKDKYYGISQGQTIYVTLYNKTLFENNGVKTPLEYYNEGDWTWETFRKVATALTQDTNKDGAIDQWGAFEWRPQNFILSTGTNLVKFKDDGSVVLNLSDSNVIEALQFYQDSIIKYKYMLPDKGQQVFAEGRLGMLLLQPFQMNSKLMKDQFKHEWDFAPYPAPASGKDPISPSDDSFWGVGNGANNPQGAAALLYIHKQINSKEELDIQKEYMTAEQIEFNNKLKNKTLIPNYLGIGDMANLMDKMFADIRKGQPVTTSIEKHLPVLQSEIDRFMEDSK